MKDGLISWLLQNHLAHEADLDAVVGPMAFLEENEGDLKVQGANAVFEKLFGWKEYNWQHGMAIEKLIPYDGKKLFREMLEQAKHAPLTEVVRNILFMTRMESVRTCRVHLTCLKTTAGKSEYLMRLGYNKQAQIKDALFTEALRQNKLNCWYWDMSHGTVTFYNTMMTEVTYEGIPFMNVGAITFDNFPQGLIDKLNFAGDYRNAFMTFVKKLLAKENTEELPVEVALETDDGRLVWVNLTGRIVFDERNVPEYVMGTWSNITQKKITEQQQQHNNYLMGTLVKDSIYDITVNLDKNFFVADNSLEKWMEETRVFSPFYDQAIRDLVTERVIKSDRQRVLDFFSIENLNKLPEDENFSIEYQRKYNGKNNWFKVTVNTFCLDEFSDKWMYALIYDIDASKQRELILERMASTDALTGLYNRAHSIELMEEYIGDHPAAQTAIMYMDLDNFKSVNDTMGHAAGDSLLICVANAMRSYFGEDAVLGRIGGDEFIMMYLSADRQIVARMMDDFVNFVGSKCQELYPGLNVTASLGYVLHPDFGSDVSVLADLADKALYEAKRHGKNKAIEYCG